MDAVPKASAAMACAPPALKMRSTPATLAAARIAGSMLPYDFAGDTVISSGTPAIFAGMASISTVEDSGVSPPGTQSPTRSMGMIFCPTTVPSAPLKTKPPRFCCAWNARMFAAAFSNTARNSGSMAARAAAISSAVTSNALSRAWSYRAA